ncbi:hypothetical protein [Stakelama saccharophila]|uniref:Uncharacterized protein n=1 Tax=Stakelama saccharophila TaxID=3075605 RepID=A0ABZ0B5Y0_9SPHN|nr:hypothetical protein [Stakelama sp. W311]WNO52806.1 hypothetical protein RPR59_10080 [Stakelama sp. W311]
MIAAYDWAGGREAVLRFGPADGPVVIAALPPLEEANRTRALVVTMLRMLAERGVGGCLPDLPGQGESEIALEETTLSDWRNAFFSAASTIAADRVFGIGIRAGALIDATATLCGRWRLAPQSGARLVRELERTAALAAREDGVPPPAGLYAGNRLNDTMLAELAAARIADGGYLRTVRLAGDPAPADAVFDAPPPWRRAEPDGAPALAEMLAEDIAHWIGRCAG